MTQQTAQAASETAPRLSSQFLPQAGFSQTPDPADALILRHLRENDMDGYTLVRKMGNNQQVVLTSLSRLCDRDLIRVDGELVEERVLDASFWISPEKKGYVDMLIGRNISGYHPKM